MNLKTIAYSIVFAAFFTAGFLSYQNSSLLSKNEEFSLENLIVKAYADFSDSGTCLSCGPDGVDDDDDNDNVTCKNYFTNETAASGTWTWNSGGTRSQSETGSWSIGFGAGGANAGGSSGSGSSISYKVNVLTCPYNENTCCWKSNAPDPPQNDQESYTNTGSSWDNFKNG